MLRKHRDHFVRGIDTGPALVCLTVEHGILRDILGDIGDMDGELEVPVREPLDSDGVIQILGVRSVDGYYPFIPQIYSRGL